ncbi:translation initiation factor IF-2 [Candidatus Atribacteria bacterium RBG_19FT_COMBO_35_14]|uniref:Translation initiation factor IF-2 n=1 Tax=Candidatus Sediminicultor quintus TaxID=1797291 RepID=A0A1F5A9N3_9BACT|nr:MAG: translation initiation factor IF-2 [Candidatus Atribacteria bacterium RBG_19FT_COMBO_35_14]
MKMRVYELAEDLKIPAKELIGFLNREGVKVKNHMSTLDNDTIELIKEVIDAEKEKKVKEKKKQLKVIEISKLPNLKELSSQLKISLSEIIQKIIQFETISSIDKEVPINTLKNIAKEYGYKIELSDKLKSKSNLQKKDKTINLIAKPPVVTVIGHVDHGKTTLLDTIRKTDVTKGEAGGITQRIGAYQINIDDKKIVFIDTPGHEAFTTMRARGVKATDVAVLVVAADDGVMPQTVEAINHAKAANVPIIVAINKIDKANANVEKVKKGLTKYDLVPEEWGGDTLMVEVSALQNKGIDKLLETISLQAEMLDLKANPDIPAKGLIIETKLEKKRGIIASVLIQDGTLKIGDYFIAGLSYGKIRNLLDDKGKNIKKAGPSTPVEIIGFCKMPQAGDYFQVVPDDKLVKIIINEREDEGRSKIIEKSSLSLDNLFLEMKEGKIDKLNIILKTDTQGSLDALQESIKKIKIENEEAKIGIIHAGVGNITETDVMFASASKAIIIGFNIRPDTNVQRIAKFEKVDIRLYKIIYDLIDEIKSALEGYLKPKIVEYICGQAEVREVFKIPKIGTIAGSYVLNGKISNNDNIRLIRDGKLIYEGKISSLKRFKEDIKEVNTGFECGIGIEKFNDIKLKDILEFYTFREIKDKKIN